MKQVRWLLFASLLLYGLLPAMLAQASTPPQVKAFIDSEGQLTLDDILTNRYSNRFTPIHSGLIELPGKSAALWLKLNGPLDAAQWLHLSNPAIKHIDFYHVVDGHPVKHLSTGAWQAPAERTKPHADFVFDLPPLASPDKLLLRLHNPYPQHTQLTFWPRQHALLLHGNLQAMEGLLTGLMLALMLHGLLQGLAGRDGLHLLLSAAALLLTLSGLSRLDWTAARLPYLYGQQADFFYLLTLPIVVLLFRAWLPAPEPIALKRLLGAGALATLVGVTLIKVWPSTFASLAPAVALLVGGSGLLMLGYLWLRQQGLRVSGLITCSALLFSGLLHFHLISNLVSEILCRLLLWTALVALAWDLYLRQKQALQARTRRQHQAATRLAERRTRAEFLSRISHEVRTPMNGVLGMSELLMDTALSSKQRDYVQTIHASGNDLLTLLNDIVDMSRLEAGEFQLDSIHFDLHALINDCLESARPRAESQQLELIGFVHPDTPRHVSGDAMRLRQIISSMLNNALQQTQEGEIVLVVSREQKSPIKDDGNELELRFAIQDTGLPLAENVRQRLLAERPLRVEAGNDGNSQLALQISRHLIDNMRGKLGIKSDEQGNTLWFTLPLTLVEQRTSQGAEDNCLHARNVLIVDDNATCRKVLQQQLGGWHMQTQSAASGKEALALLRNQANLGQPFDILLIDQSMPGMTGLELAKRIQEDPSLPRDMLLIMLTGISQIPSRVVARNAGISRILSKPVAGYSLRTTLVDEWLQHQQRVQQQRAHQVNSLQYGQAPAHKHARILVAEDNAISTKVIQGMLGKLGLQSEAVTNGEDALTRLREKPFDLVLMDCEMPQMDGYTAAQKIREWEQLQQRQPVPIIALTAHILPEHQQRATRAGMNGHMAKPVDLNQLKEQLGYWLGAPVEHQQAD